MFVLLSRPFTYGDPDWEFVTPVLSLLLQDRRKEFPIKTPYKLHQYVSQTSKDVFIEWIR